MPKNTLEDLARYIEQYIGKQVDEAVKIGGVKSAAARARLARKSARYVRSARPTKSTTPNATVAWTVRSPTGTTGSARRWSRSANAASAGNVRGRRKYP